MAKKIPQRMCIICRKMFPKNELIRIVKSPEGEIFIDESGKKSGRGAYVCKSEECIIKCNKTKAIEKNFKKIIDKNIYNKIEEKHNRNS